MTLLGNARVRLGWVKAHMVIKGNEIADTLTKEATTDGAPANRLQLSLLRCTHPTHILIQPTWSHLGFEFGGVLWCYVHEGDMIVNGTFTFNTKA
ncbi:hypothetical protein AVEN_14983-1 [Araneus ventricosus]|uniref:RNase H type-1 domain-containing protein n=1 Tax=Araneus ventricosus TaxID=182803 RepID=A0A4Y2F978_ARAVE|nr:hypothetical protein AVEN_14983-1 [Araneus ventricosus]